MIKIKKYPFIKQEEIKDCGAACMYMIIEYYKGHLSMEKLRELLKIDKSGTTAYHIVEGAKKIGFESKGVKCNLEDINEDNIILPCIANVIINNSYRHFVVIYKIDFIKNTVVIADPSNKIITMSFDIFKSIFSGIVIILYPKNTIPFEDTKNKKVKLFIHIIKSHPKLIKQLSIISFFITLLSIITSFYLQNINNSLTNLLSKDTIMLYVIVFTSLVFIKCLSSFFREKLLIMINEKINLEYTLDTFYKILSLPYKKYRSKSTGDIVTRMLDINLIKDISSKMFLILLVDIPLALCSIAILIIIHTKLFALSLIVLFLYIIVILLFKDYFKESVTKIKKDSIEVTNYMIESISNYETVKGLKIKDDVYSQFEKKFVINLKNLFNYDNTMCLQRFLKSFISEGGRILIYGIGAIMVSNNSLTFASLLTFGALLDYFYSPVQELVDLDVDIRNLDLVLDRLNDLSYDTKSSGVSNEILKGNIEFKNLIYSYNDKNNVLDDISLKIKEGEKVIVLGSSGSGKSTLFKILMKYYEINRGMVFVNDIDLNDYKEVDGINYISQNENLFTDSLYNNITLYNKLSIKNLKEITDLCEIDGIIKNNSLGYNMFIEENGFNLSGGERQRIVLARSLLKKFNILIIDEGLNQVDINLERRILKKLFSKFKNKTILIISHRVENLDLFDRKIVIENGVLKCNERRA